MKDVSRFLMCLLALQTYAGVDARFLLDLRGIPMHGRHLKLDTKGADPKGSDTLGADHAGSGSSSAASGQPYASEAPEVTVATAPAYAETTKTGSEGTTTEPQSEPKTLQSEAQSHGDAPTSAPAGESAPAIPTLESQLRRRLSEDTVGSETKGMDTRGADPAGEGALEPYAHAVFKQPVAAPVSAQTSAGGPIPLSTILFSQVPRPGKPTLAAAPTTAPGGEAAPSSGSSAVATESSQR